MVQQHNFSIIQLAPGHGRGERLNVAVVVFKDDGLDVRFPKKLDKVRALSAAIDPSAVRGLIANLENIDRLALREGVTNFVDRAEQLQGIGPVALSPLGSFYAGTAIDYELRLAAVLTNFIEPEPAISKIHPKRTRLLSLVKKSFRQERVLAKRDEDLTSHRIVQNWKLAEGLIADLVLKNGAMHVVETVDFGADDTSVRKVIADVAVSALVLEQARMSFGESDTKSKLVYDASPMLETVARPSLDAAAHQGTELINWASHEDRLKFIATLAALASPFEPPSAQKKAHFIATNQSKLALN